MTPADPHTTPELKAARRVLLDALDALHDHRDSLVLIGAQAIYLRVGAGSFSVPPTTTDADLALDIDLLADDPNVVDALIGAGFRQGPTRQPGHWVSGTGVAVDLMVAPHQSGRSGSARAARLPPYPSSTGRIAPGIAAALSDNSPMSISSLDSEDPRVHELKVAGCAALLVAKVIKIGDRLADAQAGHSKRVVDKDALDVLRLLQGTSTESVVTDLGAHPTTSPAGSDIQRALDILRSQATSADARVPTLAGRASNGDPAVPPSLAALVNELLQAWAVGPPQPGTAQT